jgi:acyl-CoA reductase-like NAD-dependent aldehyde dehydrogenase
MRHNHWIGGITVQPHSMRYLPCVDHVTLRVNDEVAAGDAADVDAAVRSAQSAAVGWASCSAADRGSVLLAIADAMTGDAAELMDLERMETGKVPAQLTLEMQASIEYLRYYAGLVRGFSGRTVDGGVGQHIFTRWRPHGVVGVITPWNLPLAQACRSIAPALAAGNAVVVKPSEFTSRSTLRLAELASAAGLQPGLLNVVTGTGAAAGAALVDHGDVDKITFTGSVPNGMDVAAMSAARLRPVTLELGGKSPLIVFDDADIDRVLNAAVSAAATNSGQVCSATARLLVHENIYDDFLTRLAAALGALVPGVHFGPMITQSQYDKVLNYFDVARDEGAQLVIGGAPLDDSADRPGRYIAPTLYRDVKPAMRVACEEIFGPVLVALSFADENEAVHLANDTEYGLVASIWSGDVMRALRMSERLRAGQISINGGPLTIDCPFGGFASSGFGREKGIEALHEYAAVTAVSIYVGSTE